MLVHEDFVPGKILCKFLANMLNRRLIESRRLSARLIFPTYIVLPSTITYCKRSPIFSLLTQPGWVRDLGIEMHVN